MNNADLTIEKVEKFFLMPSHKPTVAHKSAVIARPTVSNTLTQAHKTPIFHSISMQFLQNSSYAITGVSGTGKSTLIHLLAGIEIPDAGAVFCNGVNVNQLQASLRTRFLNQTIGLLFQKPYLIAELSVVENVIIPGLIIGKNNRESLEIARDLLVFLGLEGKLQSRPSSLSGGQQQRVALARALFNKPSFLLADEPTGSLDPKTAKEIVSFLQLCQKKWGMGLIISTHDMHLAESMDYIYEIKDGQLQSKK